MKIIDNTITNATFSSLKYGDIFKNDNGYFWIKIQGIADCSDCNAIDLEEGEPCFFEDNERVIPLPNAKLVID